MNKCPQCRLENLTFIDSHENVIYENPEDRVLLSDWEQYECQNCNLIFDVEDGVIEVKRIIGPSHYAFKYKLTTNWEKVYDELGI